MAFVKRGTRRFFRGNKRFTKTAPAHPVHDLFQNSALAVTAPSVGFPNVQSCFELDDYQSASTETIIRDATLKQFMYKGVVTLQPLITGVAYSQFIHFAWGLFIAEREEGVEWAGRTNDAMWQPSSIDSPTRGRGRLLRMGTFGWNWTQPTTFGASQAHSQHVTINYNRSAKIKNEDSLFVVLGKLSPTGDQSTFCTVNLSAQVRSYIKVRQ